MDDNVVVVLLFDRVSCQQKGTQRTVHVKVAIFYKEVEMISRKIVTSFISFAVALIPFVSAYSYEVETHMNITRNAILRSMLSHVETLRRLGLYPELDATWLVRPDNGMYSGDWSRNSVARADLALVSAARREDDGLRSLQHFFDPQNDRGLTLTDEDTGGASVFGLRSHQWALRNIYEWTDVPDYPLGFDLEEQFFTVKSSKDYLEQAVIESERFIRLRRYAQFLAAIGHVVHHVQDMAQPEHVRNDPHCNAVKCWILAPIADYEEDIYDPSGYESFVKESNYASFNQWDYPIPAFDGYTAFWANVNHAGMADFTNRFAVSKDTNFRGDLQAIENHAEFPYPDGASATRLEEVTSVSLLDGVEVSFVRTEIRASYVDENQQSGPSFDHLTATRSLFSIDIENAAALGYDVSGVLNAGFTIGRQTFESAATKLLPRAEAYSAGLINYMLRGRLGVELPARGYYALRDFDPDAGFPTLKFRLRNETPDLEPNGQGAVPQDIGEGTLTAVASYRPNPCFENDLSGELHSDEPDLIPSDCPWQTWFGTTDEVRVSSAPLSLSAISNDWAEYEFDFSANPIPYSARDLEIYFVFRGNLGSEEDAIIVERKNISEPTYVSTLNSSDYVWTSSGWQDGASLLRNEETWDDVLAAQYLEMSYDLDSATPYSIGPDSIQAGNFTRFIALVDATDFYPLRVHKDPELNPASDLTFSRLALLNETREVRDERVYQFGDEISVLAKYVNAWCDDQGCTTSGLHQERGISSWSWLTFYYIKGIGFPEPTEDDWKALELLQQSNRIPVTINE